MPRPKLSATERIAHTQERLERLREAHAKVINPNIRKLRTMWRSLKAMGYDDLAIEVNRTIGGEVHDALKQGVPAQAASESTMFDQGPVR